MSSAKEFAADAQRKKMNRVSEKSAHSEPGRSAYLYSRPSPEFSASWLQQLLYTWASELFVIAAKKNEIGKELEYEDLFELPVADQADNLVEQFEKKWTSRTSLRPGIPLSSGEAQTALFWSLYDIIKWWFTLATALRFINSTMLIAHPILINAFLLNIQELYEARTLDRDSVGVNKTSAPANMTTAVTPLEYEGYLWALGLVLALLLVGILEALYFWVISRCGWRVRTIVSTAVFRKSLRLSNSALRSVSEGEIVNYMQIDAQRLESFVLVSISLWDGIFQIVGYVIIIYFFLGDATFVGLAIMFVAMVLQGITVFFLAFALRRVAKFTDQRLKCTNEALHSILFIKMSGWESKLVERITNYRKHELKSLKWAHWMGNFIFACITVIPAIVATGTISFYALQNGKIDAATLFAVINAFGSLRLPLLQYPAALQAYAAGRIGLRRLANFLTMDETKNDRRTVTSYDGDDTDVVVRITNGEFYWGEPKQPLDKRMHAVRKAGTGADVDNSRVIGDAQLPQSTCSPVLQDIDICIKRGQLVAIVGPVGVGKSALLFSILGETFQAKGTTSVVGSIAYTAQTAWIQNATLRENILFGQPFDKDRYWNVIRVCQLERDLADMDDGDQTMIGEKGINLSGGQAQRVSAARAAYSSKSIVLLDDPMSAVDAEVGSALFDQCIVDLLSDRTRVMVTNQLNLLHRFDLVVVLSNGTEEEGEGVPTSSVGKIVEQGSFPDLMQRKGRLSKLISKFNASGSNGENGDNSETVSTKKHEKNVKVERNKNEGRALMQIEERAHGAVQVGEYEQYVKAGGGWLLFCLVLFFVVLAQLAGIGNTVVVSLWTNSVAADGEYVRGSLDYFMLLYVGSAVVSGILAFVRGIFIILFTFKASRRLHDSLVSGLFRAPMSFFDTTPTGRILSRFSKDMYALDLQMPQAITFFLFAIVAVLLSVVALVSTIYYVAAALPILIFIYYRIVRYYRPVARDAKRLESISRSPVYAHLSETLGGLSTIRAYERVDDFKTEDCSRVDNNIRCYYITRVAEMWLEVRLRLLSTTLAAVSCVLILLAVDLIGLTPGIAGLALTMMLAVSGLLGATISSFVLLETSMNAVERINHYAHRLETESFGNSNKAVPEDWPQEGKIMIKDLYMRYRLDTKFVLRGVTVAIPGKSTVGIVGRSGCGKSSLLLTLLRIVEADSGSIVIDNVDISTIGLMELRQKLSIVPQNPVMFSGTIRSNMDPFNKYSDEDLLSSLERTSMRRTVEHLEKGLDTQVAEYGNNFSQGQRQLLCMGRSLLSQTRILLLDEATSSVDNETDASIQQAMRVCFAGRTVLTIAHRIQTVIDYNFIMVMSAGTIVEFDKPETLLADEKSVFKAIVDEAAPQHVPSLS